MRPKVERDERERENASIPSYTLPPGHFPGCSPCSSFVSSFLVQVYKETQKKCVQEDNYPELKHGCITSFISASEIHSRILISSFLGSLKIQLNLMQKKWKKERERKK